jgi:hypothetical protein
MPCKSSAGGGAEFSTDYYIFQLVTSVVVKPFFSKKIASAKKRTAKKTTYKNPWTLTVHPTNCLAETAKSDLRQYGPSHTKEANQSDWNTNYRSMS